MKIHPEMREVIDAEMREGLRFWRDKSPEEINRRMREKMVREQKVLLDILGLKSKELAVKEERTPCECPYMPFGGQCHLPWCEAKKTITFVLGEKLKKKFIDGRDWYFGHSGFMPPFIDDEGKNP